jgi:3-hydroxymyristoyl/3-hydroxydecanoyl-(acyl carrier protein) dehydratase
MKFCLVDRVVTLDETSAVTLKAVSMAEEYLQDHFATFPALPGVFMLEAMVQACRLVCERGGGGAADASREDVGRASPPWVLGAVKALKYGTFVRPGDVLRVRVEAARPSAAQASTGTPPVERVFKAEAEVLRMGASDAAADAPAPIKAASGRITLRPASPLR